MKTLNISTLPSEGWVDKDIFLFHACFQLLVDFVEQEKGLEHTNYETHKENIDTLGRLYGWWKNVKDFDHLKHQDKLKLLIEHNTSLWI